MAWLSIEDFMNIQTIISNAKKPAPYTPGTAQMWVDDYISTQLLQIHLNQNVELASRKETTIAQTIDWILNKVDGSQLSVLDLGCGPGLYTEKLAKLGHRVTGVDFSAHSIEYAKNSAQKNELNICYRHQDYLSLTEENEYDLIIMIFTDFGVLSPEQRTSLLARIHKALKPGGTFIFDVLNEHTASDDIGNRDWEIAESGFWRPAPYLVLSDSFYYEDEAVTLNQHVVIEENGKYEIYRFWVHTFSHSDLKQILNKAGFRAVNCYSGVIPDSDLCPSDSVTFCTVKK